jgi:hypothetical protein
VQLVETMLRYRETPAVYMCHDGTCWNARAPLFSRIQSYLAVDWNCRERVSRETGFLLEEIPVVSNTVDLAVFSPRTALPARPRRILIFGRETHSITYLRSVKAACALVGLKPDVISEGVRAWTDQPATVLAQYDIVVAKARCALEALAVGCHVILCSSSGLGPGITMENFETLYRWNLGTRLLTEPASPAAIRQRMESYSPLRTLALRDRVRSTCGVEHSADQLLRIYTKAMARFQERPRPTTGEELASLNRYFLSLEQELHQFDSRVIQAHYRGIARRLMRHLRTRPRLRRFLKKIWYWMARD